MVYKYLDDFTKTLENHPNNLAPNFYRGANLASKNDKSIKVEINFFNYFCLIYSEGVKDKIVWNYPK